MKEKHCCERCDIASSKVLVQTRYLTKSYDLCRLCDEVYKRLFDEYILKLEKEFFIAEEDRIKCCNEHK